MERKGYKLNGTTYSILINGFYKKGKLEEANFVRDQMSVKGLGLNTVGYNSFISAYCKGGKVHEAFRIYAEMSGKT